MSANSFSIHRRRVQVPADSCALGGSGHRHAHKLLLACGILSSLWYVAINIIVPSQWSEYSVVNQTVSELSAIGAPTRSLWIVLVMPYVLLFAAFGWGVLRSAGTNRALRMAAWPIIFYCAFNAFWPPMHGRDALSAGGRTLSDTLHLVWAGVTTTLFLLIMGCAAVALPGGFRFFTISSLVLLIVFGSLTSMAAPDVARNLPTPWIGVWSASILESSFSGPRHSLSGSCSEICGES